MTIYLLDKNIVDDIHDSLAGNRSVHIRVARSIDRKGDFISPLLASLEGSDQRPQSAVEVRESLLLDIQAVGMFYQHARTDTVYMHQAAEEFAISLGAHMREKANELLPLALELQTLLSRTYSVVDAWPKLAEIDARARAHNIDVNHPLIGSAIARLYGHPGATRVFKAAVTPDEGISYNSIYDIRMLVELAYIKHMLNEQGQRQHVKLLTRDKGLNELAEFLKVTVIGESPLIALPGQHDVRYGSQLPDELFPKLRQLPAELQRVRDYITQTRTSSAASMT